MIFSSPNGPARAALKALICRMSGQPIGDDACVVSPDEFERVRAAVCVSGPASDGDNLLGMEIDACAFLGDPAYAGEDDPGPWHDMSVQRSEGSEWLINGRGCGRTEDAAAIAEALPYLGGAAQVQLPIRAHCRLRT